MSDPVAVSDPSVASPTERAVLMCIERIDELERKVQDTERKLRDSERNSFVHLLTVTGEFQIIVYVEVACFVLGLSPEEFVRRKKNMFRHMASSVWDMLVDVVAWAMTARHDPVALERAEELHRACFSGAPPPPPFWSTEFAVLTDREMSKRINVMAMIRMLTESEAEAMWEWRIARAGWYGMQ
jgi:hypothetical protein